jgi:hypothetical protein
LLYDIYRYNIEEGEVTWLLNQTKQRYTRQIKLKPVAAEDQKTAELQGYSVNIEGIIYSVKASSAEEAGEKAKELHNKTKGNKS